MKIIAFFILFIMFIFFGSFVLLACLLILPDLVENFRFLEDISLVLFICAIALPVLNWLNNWYNSKKDQSKWLFK